MWSFASLRHLLQSRSFSVPFWSVWVPKVVFRSFTGFLILGVVRFVYSSVSLLAI